MSRVTYMSLIPQDSSALAGLMAPDETEPHLTLCLFGPGNNAKAHLIAETIGFCPAWVDNPAFDTVTARVTSQSVYGRGARVLELSPEALNPLRVVLIEWLIDNDLKPQNAVGAWAPHVTLGRNMDPVEQYPRYLTFDRLRVKGLTSQATFNLRRSVPIQ